MPKIDKEKAEEIIKDLLAKTFSRFKQEMAGENEEFLDRVVRQFRAQVARCSWKAAQKWCKWNEDGPVLMPDYTRIYYRKGSTEILLQEFPPQLRIMKFDSLLAKRANTGEKLPREQLGEIHHYSLALPYVVFIFRFVNGMYEEVRCFFSDRPLKRLTEKPLKPYLPNIDSTMKVCLGSSFQRSELEKDNITQQSAFVLSHFWHTSYTDEWSNHFWACKKHFQENDPRLATFEDWQEASADNPLFVIEDVDWLHSGEENIGDMIVRMIEEDQQNHVYGEELYDELTGTFLQDITKVFNDNVDAIEQRIVEKTAAQLADDLLADLR